MVLRTGIMIGRMDEQHQLRVARGLVHHPADGDEYDRMWRDVALDMFDATPYQTVRQYLRDHGLWRYGAIRHG